MVRLGRIKISGSLLVGKFYLNAAAFWGINEGVRVGPVSETDEDIEFLTTDPACTIPWMPYAAGGLLPAGVISGGRLTDGSPTYAVKVIRNGIEFFGYYNTKSGLAYYEDDGVRTETSMQMLVLL